MTQVRSDDTGTPGHTRTPKSHPDGTGTARRQAPPFIMKDRGERAVLHLEGAPRTGTEWASTIPIIPGQGHFSGQRHELTPPCHETARLTAQRYVLVLIPFQGLVDLLNAVVGPHLIQHIEVRID